MSETPTPQPGAEPTEADRAVFQRAITLHGPFEDGAAPVDVRLGITMEDQRRIFREIGPAYTTLAGQITNIMLADSEEVNFAAVMANLDNDTLTSAQKYAIYMLFTTINEVRKAALTIIGEELEETLLWHAQQILIRALIRGELDVEKLGVDGVVIWLRDCVRDWEQSGAERPQPTPSS